MGIERNDQLAGQRLKQAPLWSSFAYDHKTASSLVRKEDIHGNMERRDPAIYKGDVRRHWQTSFFDITPPPLIYNMKAVMRIHDNNIVKERRDPAMYKGDVRRQCSE